MALANLHVLGNVPGKLVDGKTSPGCLFTTDEIDVCFLHELHGLRLDCVVWLIKRELGRYAR